jgi:hypothetical protein
MRSSANLATIAVAVFLVGAQSLPAQGMSEPCNILCLSARAREALLAERHAEYLRFAREVAERAPDHPGGIYAVARGFALLGQQDSAIVWLSRLAEIGGAHDIGSDPAFSSIKTVSGFQALAARLEWNAAPVIRGRPAFAVRDPDLLPEALTWDPVRNRWIIGSLAKRKIVAREPDGTWTDLVVNPRMLRVVGIHVDTTRNLLWFATWEPISPLTGNNGEGRLTRTRLFKSDLATGLVLRVYEPVDTTKSHLLNDLAIAPNGDVYVTDTQAGWLYRVAAATDSLEVFLQPDPTRFSGANGITIAGDGRTLYVAFIEGVARVDLATRRLAYLPSPRGVSTSGVDGLYWYRGDLISVQNPPGMERIVRLELDPSGDAVVGADVLERAHEVLQIPTTGAIVGTRFYYIANSQANRLDSDNGLRPAPASPPPLTIVRVIDFPPPG